jgi:intein/homing endonuclease
VETEVRVGEEGEEIEVEVKRSFEEVVAGKEKEEETVDETDRLRECDRPWRGREAGEVETDDGRSLPNLKEENLSFWASKWSWLAKLMGSMAVGRE